MWDQHSTTKMKRIALIATAFFALTLCQSEAWALSKSPARFAPRPVPSPQGRQLKFVVNIRNGAIATADAASYVTHDMLASTVGATEKDGFLWGIAERNNGDVKIAILTADIKDPVQKAKWGSDFLNRYIQTTLAGNERFRDFHGGRVVVNDQQRGFFDWTQGVTSAPPQPLSTPTAPSGSGTTTTQPPEGVISGEPDFDPETKKLYEMIRDTDLKAMDIEFFKKVYATPEAPNKLKKIFALTTEPFPQKNRRLSELRKWYDWTIQADYARQNNITIENTNQGKDNGVRSDLDATANLLEKPEKGSGKMILKSGVADLIAFQKVRYAADGLNPDNVDVTLFNGDTWLPDWRDSRMSYDQFKRETFKAVWDLKNRKGAYFVPGANKEQPHDRALVEGHTIHISWDYIGNRPMINGKPVKFDFDKGAIVDADTNEPVKEYNTREMAQQGVVVRYQGMEVMQPNDMWRRALGNVVQNTLEFLTHDEPGHNDPVSRNKYFIERVIDQAVGRFHNTYRLSYVEVHASALPGDMKISWKRAFIQQAFGIPEGDIDAITRIQSVLDRASEIQLDKTGKWHDGRTADYNSRRKAYYAEEIEEAKKKVAEWYQINNPPDDHPKVLELAERLFVEKQREIMIEAGVRVVEETFKRDFTPEGIQYNRDRFGSVDAAKNIMLDRGVELALLMDIIESAPRLTPQQRQTLKQRVIGAIPPDARPLVENLARLSALKLDLIGREGFDPSNSAKRNMRPHELIAQVEQEIKRLLGDVESQSLPDDEVRKSISQMIRQVLGPLDSKRLQESWEQVKKELSRIGREAGGAYWNEIKEQMDFLMVTGAALGMIDAYEKHCAGQPNWTDECVTGLSSEAGNQILYMLPGINTGYMILSGLKEIGRGNRLGGSITLGFGAASLPPVARALGTTGAAVIKLYIALQLVRVGYGVTIGYVMQKMENDAVEQAFKALPSMPPPARRYSYPNEPSFSVTKAITPNYPLLFDAKELDPNTNSSTLWDDDRRFDAAQKKFAPDIQDELQASGLQPNTAGWSNKKIEITRRFASSLPYVERTEKIYSRFHSLMQQEGIEYPDIFTNCVADGQKKVEDKYKAPPGFWDSIRYWWDEKKKAADKQNDSGAVWSTCIQRSVAQEGSVFEAVFNKYLDNWFTQQYDEYRRKYDNDDMRKAIRGALMNQYIAQRYLDMNREKMSQEMEKAARTAKDVSTSMKKVMGSLLQSQNNVRGQTEQRLEQSAVAAYAGNAPEVTPEFKLKAPSYSVRLGQQPAAIDIIARGQYFHGDEQKNSWKAVLTSELVSAVLGAPDDPFLTKEIKQDLEQKQGDPPRQVIKVDEKLTGELKNGKGEKLATAETVVHHYEVLPKWRGEISVEVRADGPRTDKNSTDPRRGDPYVGARVRLTGPSDTEKESEWKADNYAGVFVDKMPAGSVKIHVEPKSNDKLHSPIDAVISLNDFAPALGWVPQDGKKEDEEGQALSINRYDQYQNGKPVGDAKNLILVRWKDSGSITVVLPYVAPPEPPEKPEQQKQANQTNNPPTPPPGPATRKPDPQALLDCQKLISQADQFIAAGDLASAAQVLKEAQQKKCDGLDPNLGQELTNAQQQIEDSIKNLIDEIKKNMSTATCEYEEAWRLAQKLRQIDPNHPALATINLAELQGFATSQHAARAELRIGKAAIENKNLDGAIASLQKALYVPGLPDCMRPPMVELKTELERRKEFIVLTQQVEQATTECDYDKAAQFVGQITNLRPRYQFISDWLGPNIQKLADLQNRKKQAINFINNADTLVNQANTLSLSATADWTAITPLLENASRALADADKVAPKCLKERSRMDPLRQRILDIQRKKKAQIETSIVLLIDTSGSMRDNDKIGKAKDAARKAVRNASKTTEMAILNFDGGCSAGAVRIACPFTTDVNALMAAIDGLAPGGGTPMYIAVGVATDYASKKGRGKQGVVILMSDGGDSCRDQMAKAAADIRASNIPVNTIGFDVGNNQQAQQDMQNLAGITGGRSFSASAADPNEIINAFKIALLPSLFKDFDLAAAGSAVQNYFSAAKTAIQHQDLNGATFNLQQAYKVAPDSPAVNFNLSLVHEANDQPLSAIKHAENYLRLAPNALDRGDVENRVSSMKQEVQRNPRAQYDPNSCREIYNWAQAEKEAAKRDVLRRQAILEILIASQRGDCENARKLQERYKQGTR
jgi:Mg-chelatase subunit ChlD